MKNTTFLIFPTADLPTANAQPDPAPEFYGTDEYKTIIVALLAIVIVVGFVGNLAVFGAISQRQKWSTTSSYFLLMNIAIADLLVAVIVAPLRFLEMFHGWSLGQFLCQALAAIQDVIVCVSVVTHTVIALERYRAVVQPFKKRLSIQRTKQAIGIIWLACYIAIGLPLALLLRERLLAGRYICVLEWPSDLVRQVFEVYLVLVIVVIPLVIQTYAYSYVVKKVNHEIMSSTALTDSDIRLNKAARSKARVVKMLILLVGAFHLSSIPRVVTLLLWEFGGTALQSDPRFQYALTITVIIYYLKHVVNPFIIFATSQEYRETFCFICYRRSGADPRKNVTVFQ